MADAGFFKGTSADQDSRFSDKELKLLRTLKFPPEFSEKVDMRKVNLQVMRPWIANKVTELVGFEDEVVVEYAMGLLEDPSQPLPDPRKMQINLTGFLTAKTPEFMIALWKLLVEAQASPGGIPKTFVEEKKEEMRRARENDARVLGEADRRSRLDEIRDRERSDRGGRGRGKGRGGRGRDGGFDDNRPARPRDSGWGARGGGRSRFHSRSPPLVRRRSITPPPRRPARSPSPSSRGRSPSRTPTFRRKTSLSRSRSPIRRRPRSRSDSPPSRRRRLRSPSYSPPPRRRSSPPRRRSPPRRNVRDSRSPPPRHRRLSPPTRSRSRRRDFSRSPPPHMRRDRRRDSRSVSSRSRSRSRSRSPVPTQRRRSTSRSHSRTPPRRDPGYRDGESRRRAVRRDSRNLSIERRERGRRSPSPMQSIASRDSRGGRMEMDVDRSPKEELKIKGQAELNRNKESVDKIDLAKRESELKEKALRNKVIRTRKPNTAGP